MHLLSLIFVILSDLGCSERIVDVKLHYSPEIWTNTVLLRGPSNSKNNTDCQVPKANFPSTMGIISLVVSIIAIKWEWALIGSSSGTSLKCKSLCKYLSDSGASFFKNTFISSNNLTSFSLIAKAVVVWRENTKSCPFLIDVEVRNSWICGVILWILILSIYILKILIYKSWFI